MPLLIGCPGKGGQGQFIRTWEAGVLGHGCGLEGVGGNSAVPAENSRPLGSGSRSEVLPSPQRKRAKAAGAP